MTAQCYRGNAPVAGIAPGHRGIAYGDGLFETMRVHGGDIPWWTRHVARLSAGAERLRIRLPDMAFARAQAQALCEKHGDGVLKLGVTRGEGGRGYAADPDADTDWQLSWHPLPHPAPAAGLALRWCATRLALQPALAGLKHCNRLEQVLARLEWNAVGAVGADADEGLLLDAEGCVIGATAANVFVLRDGRWRTPAVDRCGVAGVCRGWAIDALGADVARLAPAQVEAADAIFLCNAVRGILPVARLGGRAWHDREEIHAARRALASSHPAFRMETP